MMNWQNMLRHYATDLDADVDLMEEAILTLENIFSNMDTETLLHKSRPLAIAYLALCEAHDERPAPGDTRLPAMRERRIMSEPVLVVKSGQVFSPRFTETLREDLIAQISRPGETVIIGTWADSWKWKYGRVEQIREYFDHLPDGKTENFPHDST